MYATAHRVLARRSQQQGINAFLHLHDSSSEVVDWRSPDRFAVVTEQNPGRLVNEVIEIIPGGNEVQSHLDVVAPDGTPLDAVRAALAKAAEILPDGEARSLSDGNIVVAFGCQIGLRGAEKLEFDELSAAIDRVLAQPAAPRTQGAPVRIGVSHENGAVVCRLDQAEMARIAAVQGHPHESVAVRTARDVLDDFEEIYGEIGPEFAQVITGLTLEQLFAIGGFQFVDAATHRVLRQWPRARE